MSTDRRYLSALADAASLRTAVFDDREHIVVPVVALVGDSVVRPMNSRGPELVPADELATAPTGWDGRPVVPDHPVDGGSAVSANTPHTLERYRFGQMFNTRFEDKRLKTEAWLDVARAAKLGGDAADVIRRLQAGETIEVSVGCFVNVEQRSGVASDGTRYDYVWHEIVPDHLAMLPAGATGACSVDAGCGAPRAAKAIATPTEDKPMSTLRSMFNRLLSRFAWRGAADPEGEGVNDLRSRLWSLLHSSVAAFADVVDIFPDSNTVIYVTASGDPATGEMSVAYWSCSYEGEGDALVVSTDATQVQPVTKWEPVATSLASGTDTETKPEPVAARAACGCEQGKAVAAEAHNDRGGTMSKIKELAGRLIACSKSPFTETDRAALESLSETTLNTLADTIAAQPVTEPVAAQPVTEPEVKVKTEEEMIAELPETLRSMIKRAQEEEAAQRTGLISSLRAASDAFTEEQLKAKTTDELAALAKLAKVETRDYSGRGLAESRSATAAPRPYEQALAQQRASAPKAN